MKKNAEDDAKDTSSDEMSGDWIRDQLNGVPLVAEQQQEIPELKNSTAKEKQAQADSVTELATALLDATTKPLQAVEREWSAQLGALQTRVDERSDLIDRVTTNAANLEAAIESVQKALRGTEERTERAESQANDCLEKLGSLEAAMTEQFCQLSASIEDIQQNVAKQEHVLRELQQAEQRRGQAVEQLTQIFSGMQETVGLLATRSSRPLGEPESG